METDVRENNKGDASIVKTISIEANYGWPGANRSSVIQVPDNYTKEDIDELVYDWVFENVNWSWEELE